MVIVFLENEQIMYLFPGKYPYIKLGLSNG